MKAFDELSDTEKVARLKKIKEEQGIIIRKQRKNIDDLHKIIVGLNKSLYLKEVK